MTTQIKATCPDCGDINLTPDDIRLMICNNDQTLSHYIFDCSGCVEQIRKPADDRVISLLRSGGVRMRFWCVPAEALEEKPGPAIGYDDLLEYGLLKEDQLAALAYEHLSDQARADIIQNPAYAGRYTKHAAG
jgi:hypothetical protein